MRPEFVISSESEKSPSQSMAPHVDVEILAALGMTTRLKTLPMPTKVSQ